MDQIRYLIDRAGPYHVALGSDLYRSPNADYPDGSTLLPQLLAALHDAGYDGDVLTGIAYANWLRVLHATWWPTPNLRHSP